MFRLREKAGKLGFHVSVVYTIGSSFRKNDKGGGKRKFLERCDDAALQVVPCRSET